MRKTIGIVLCAVGAVVLAWLTTRSTDYYWMYLLLAALLGVAAGIIKNLPDPPQ
jgi:nitrate/nitrite transporter NarK